MKKVMIIISIVFGLYIVICGLAFALQEKLIFFPETLDKDHVFNFSGPYEEVYITMGDEKVLHGLLFKSDNSRGLIFYLHGNGGSLERWGDVAETYTRLQYDVFLLDYRGYGKSEGYIETEPQLFQDVQTAYDEMRKIYPEEKIVVLGYSIGTGPASKLASANNPKLLILQASYYSLTDMAKRALPFVPAFLLKYKMETHRYLMKLEMPVVLIHGDQDEVIPYSQSLKLKALLKESDTLITLNGQGHNAMTYNPDYVKEIERILR